MGGMKLSLQITNDTISWFLHSTPVDNVPHDLLGQRHWYSLPKLAWRQIGCDLLFGFRVPQPSLRRRSVSNPLLWIELHSTPSFKLVLVSIKMVNHYETNMAEMWSRLFWRMLWHHLWPIHLWWQRYPFILQPKILLHSSIASRYEGCIHVF